MNEYSIVYLGPFDRAPFFGGSFWFDKDVPQAVRGDLAAQLLFTKTTDGGQQFQLASEADFNGMLFDGFIAAGTAIDGFVWAGGSRAVEQGAALPDGATGDAGQATQAAVLADVTSTDETNSGNGETNAAGDETIEGDSGTDVGTDAANTDGTDASAAPTSTRSSRRSRNTGAQA